MHEVLAKVVKLLAWNRRWGEKKTFHNSKTFPLQFIFQSAKLIFDYEKGSGKG
jgi:hypothetical protein